MSHLAISIRNLTKTFFIYEDRKATLKSLFAGFFRQGKTKRYEVLDDISLDIMAGEFLGIIGRNGSGKSTLLKIIAGIYAADKGSKLEVNGKVVPFLELGVGFNAELSGRENIFLNGTILGMSRKHLSEKFADIVGFAELENFIDMPIKNYSSGMMLRLAFSIAIQASADIYILDEILAVGDEAFQRKSLGVIETLRQEGKTVLFVSHSMDAIVQHCSRAIYIKNGQIASEGDPTEVAKFYQKDASRNYLPAQPLGRCGSSEIMMDSIIVQKEDIETLNTLTLTNNLTIEISYSTKIVNKFRPVVGFQITDSFERLCFGTHSGLESKILLDDQGQVTIDIDVSGLAKGEYKCNLAIADEETGARLDWFEEAFEFSIRRDSEVQGYLYLPVKFRKL